MLPPPAATATLGTRAAQDALQQKRKEAPNTLHLVTHIACMEGLQQQARLLLKLTEPLKAAHSALAHSLRTQEANFGFYLQAAKGSYLQELQACVKVLEHLPTLQHLGFDVAFTALPRGNLLQPRHPIVQHQDDLAEQAVNLLTAILAERCSSMAWHSHQYPGLVALLGSTSASDREAFLQSLRLDHAAAKEVAALSSGSAFFKALHKVSMFRTPFLAELARALVDSPSQATVDTWSLHARHLFSGMVQTKCVEDTFQSLRERESRDNTHKVFLPLRQLSVVADLQALEAHGFQEVRVGESDPRGSHLGKEAFKPAPATASLQADSLTGATTWPTFSPASAKMLPASLALARHCQLNGCWDQAPGAWCCDLAPRGTLLWHKGTDKVYCSLGAIGHVCLMGWQMVSSRMKAKRVVAFGGQEENAQIHWLPLLTVQDFKVLPYQPVSPLHSHLLCDRKPSKQAGSLALLTASPISILENAAKHCFWQLGAPVLRKVMAMEGLQAGPRAGLVECLVCLLEHLMPAASKEDIKEVLALRAIPPPGSAMEGIDEGIMDDLCPDVPKAKSSPSLEDLGGSSLIAAIWHESVFRDCACLCLPTFVLH